MLPAVQIADVLTYAGDHLVAPILTGITVGLALRAVAIRGEVNDHDARVEELDLNLDRWVSDRNRQLDEEITRAAALAQQGVIEDAVEIWVPEQMRKLPPGSQRDSGAFVRRCERIMRQALHEYRDAASRAVSEYRRVVRTEGWLHRRFRGGDLEPLALPESARDAVPTWRRREVPAYGRPVAEVKDDPSRAPNAAEIQPLEEAGGLSAEAARASRMSADK